MAKKKTEAETTLSAWESAWTNQVGAFCAALGIDENAFCTAMLNLVGERSEDALAAFSSDEFTPLSDIQVALANAEIKIPVAKLRMHIGKLRAPAATVNHGEDKTASMTTGPAVAVALPTLPDEESFLKALRTGGNLKVDRVAVIAAIRTALAAQSGIFDLPKEILARMEKHADSLDEPVGSEFFTVRKLVASRRYGDVLAAFDVNASFVSETRKQDFLERVNKQLLPRLRIFQDELHRWQQSWMTSVTSGGAGMAMLMMSAGSGSGNNLPPGMLQPPDVAPIIAKAETIIDGINRTFAGVGMLVSRALAHEAGQILELLNNNQLPTLIGSMNREQMLKDLNIRVLSDHVRMEQGLARFTLGIMELPTLSGNELAYVTALYQLGSTLFPSMGDEGGRSDRKGRQSYL